ncbi:hypothetical protein ACYPKM_03530 [Pseudomonas aeruginosa]
MGTNAVIRCAIPKEHDVYPDKPIPALEVYVRMSGGSYAAATLAKVCSKIIWGDQGLDSFIRREYGDHEYRFCMDDGLLAMVYGLFFSEWDQIFETQFKSRDGIHTVRLRGSHNVFYILGQGCIDESDVCYTYDLELREYPSPYEVFENPKRVWIEINKGRKDEHTFSGWPEDLAKLVPVWWPEDVGDVD